MKRVIPITLALAALLTAPLAAQTLGQQNQDILNELRQIRQLLEKLAGPLGGQPGAPVPPQAAAPVDDHVRLANVTGLVLGKPDAPLTMVEFTDLQCPFCRQFHVRAVGVSGTPTFVIGRTSASGLDGVRLVGAQPYAVFDGKLKELLAKPATP